MGSYVSVRGHEVSRELHIAQERTHSTSLVIRTLTLLLLTELFYICVGILALYVNLRGPQLEKIVSTSAAQWDVGDWLAFLGLANALSGIVDQEAVGNLSVMTFLFAGEDAIWDAEDEDTRWEVEADVLRRLAGNCGTLKGFLMFF